MGVLIWASNKVRKVNLVPIIA